MQHSVAAYALPVIVHGRPAAARIGPEDAIADVAAAAADLVGPAVDLAVAARVVSAVHDFVSATTGVTAVESPQDRLFAAPVCPVVVDLRSTAGRIPTVRAWSH